MFYPLFQAPLKNNNFDNFFQRIPKKIFFWGKYVFFNHKIYINKFFNYNLDNDHRIYFPGHDQVARLFQDQFEPLVFGN
jgi:hypothetical protein